MGSRGIAPKPTALKILHGEKNKDRINLNEPKPKPVMPECPDIVTGGARKVWDSLGPILVRLGVLKETDGLAFAALCVEWSRYSELCKSEEGEIVQIFENGTRQVAPEVSVSHKCLTQLIKLFALFGLTPSSRAGLIIKGDEGDDFSEFLT